MAHSVYVILRLLFCFGHGGEVRVGLMVGASLTVGLVVAFVAPGGRQSLSLRPILANGFVVGLVLSLVMEHLVLPRRGRG
jgi:uracil permease